MRAYERRRSGEVIIRRVEIGDTSLRGRRIEAFQIDDWFEAKKLATPDGMHWFTRCVIPAFLTSSQKQKLE